MLLRTSAFLLAALASHAALAQSNTFELHLNGKNIGEAGFTISKAMLGYKVDSKYRYASPIYEGQYKAENAYNENYGFIDGHLDSSFYVFSHHDYMPNKAMTSIVISNILHGAVSPSESLDIKPDFIFLPTFDPGAAQALLLHAVTHPAPDSKYDVLIPDLIHKGSAPTGAQADDTLPPGDHVYDAIWIKGGPLTGTLAGKPININTYALAFGKFRWIFFADEQNNLMQLNVTAIHASYIRTDFKLDPPKPAKPQ